jgi:hypothetical protein
VASVWVSHAQDALRHRPEPVESVMILLSLGGGIGIPLLILGLYCVMRWS